MFKFIWDKELKCYYTEHNSSIKADKNGNVFGGGSTKIQQGGTTTPTPTEEEKELNRLQLEQMRAIQPYAIPLQQQAYGLGSLLLQGQGLPGYLAGLPAGATAEQIPLSAGVMGEDITNEIVRRSLRDIFPQFQAMGLPIESGVAQSIAGRTAGDIRTQVAQSDLERQLAIREANLNVGQATQYQNLNNLLNLLNLAVGGQAQIQQPVIATGGTLGQRLAGLRTIQTTGYQTQREPWYSILQPMGQLAGGIGGFMRGWKT